MTRRSPLRALCATRLARVCPAAKRARSRANSPASTSAICAGRPTSRDSRCCANRDLVAAGCRAAVRRPCRDAARAFARLLVSPGPILRARRPSAAIRGARPGRCARRALRAGDIVLNCFSYHLTPGGHSWRAARLRSAARHPRRPRQHRTADRGDRASQAQRLLRHARFPEDPARQGARVGRDVSSIKQALVSGAALPPSLARRTRSRGIKARQSYATADLGVIAYETDDAEGACLTAWSSTTGSSSKS